MRVICIIIFLIVVHLSPLIQAQERVADWVMETSNTAWQVRDSQGELVYKNRLWILGGWFNSNEAPPRDVWSSEDGIHWTKLTSAAPWHERLWFSSVVYRDRIWVMAGWSNNPYKNHSDVWSSKDGIIWEEFKSENVWKGRHEQSAFIFQDKIWIAGGMTPPLVNDVWSLKLPKGW